MYIVTVDWLLEVKQLVHTVWCSHIRNQLLDSVCSTLKCLCASVPLLHTYIQYCDVYNTVVVSLSTSG